MWKAARRAFWIVSKNNRRHTDDMASVGRYVFLPIASHAQLSTTQRDDPEHPPQSRTMSRVASQQPKSHLLARVIA